MVLADGQRLRYDHLILAAGATHSYFGNDHWQVHAPGLKTLADAFQLRARLLSAFERAETLSDADRRAPWLNFVVIGGGPTGVEMAGTLAEIARHTLRDEFRRIDPSHAQVLLVEGSDRVLAAFKPEQSALAKAQLERLGVQVRTGCRVVGIDEEGVDLQTADGASERIASRTKVWAAGVAASGLLSPTGSLPSASTAPLVDFDPLGWPSTSPSASGSIPPPCTDLRRSPFSSRSPVW